MLKSTKMIDLSQWEPCRLSLFDKIFCWFLRVEGWSFGSNSGRAYRQKEKSQVCWLFLVCLHHMHLAHFYSAVCPQKADLCAFRGPGSSALWTLVGLNQWETLTGDWGMGGKEGRVLIPSFYLSASHSSTASVLLGLLTPFLLVALQTQGW